MTKNKYRIAERFEDDYEKGERRKYYVIEGELKSGKWSPVGNLIEIRTFPTKKKAQKYIEFLKEVDNAK